SCHQELSPMSRSTVCLSRFVAVLLLVASPLAIGCTATKTSDRSIIYVDPGEASALSKGESRLFGLGRGATVAYVDARTAEEFRTERLPGALHVPLASVREQHRILREFDVLVVYGNDYNSTRADALSKILIELGRDVRTLRGGLRAWRE